MADSQNVSPSASKRRKYTSRACDACKGKKLKCDGTYPCSRCSAHALNCSYETPYLRGLAPPSPPRTARHEVSRHHRTSATGDDEASRESLRLRSSREESRADSPGGAVEETHSETAASSRVEGVLGESSNIAFLHSAQLQLRSQPSSPPPDRRAYPEITSRVPRNGSEREAIGAGNRGKSLHQSNTLYFQEAPFQSLDLARYSVPSIEHGLTMIKWYFDNASPTYRFLHRPSVEKMAQNLCVATQWLGRSSGSTRHERLTHHEQALVMMTWSLGCQYPISEIGKPLSSSEKEWLEQKAEDFYLAAGSILERSKSLVDTLLVLQVKLMMSIYLLSTSRLKSAWDLFAVVKNMANNLDLSKPILGLAGNASTQSRDARNQSGTSADLHSELRRRSFWAIYTLDSYLASMLGKSLTFDDSEIHVQYPMLVEDNQLGPDNTVTALDHGHNELDDRPSLMLGPIAHAKLAYIMRRALKFLYRGQDVQNQLENAEVLLKEVDHWEDCLPEFLKSRSSGGLEIIYARQKSVIQLAKHHAIIVTCRPFLPLSSLASSPAVFLGADTDKITEHQNRCLAAALAISDLVGPLVRKNTVGGHFWYTTHIVFCAATVLLVYIGHHPGTGQFEQIWEAARRCCEIERSLMNSNALARRYVAALEGFMHQVKKRLKRHRLDRDTGSNGQRISPLQVRSTDSYGPVSMATTTALSAFPSTEDLVPDLQDNLPFGDADFFQQPSLEQLIDGTFGNTSFFDLDSLVTSGVGFSWTV